MIALVTASEAAIAQHENRWSKRVSEMYPRDVLSARDLDISLLEKSIKEGENPVYWFRVHSPRTIYVQRVELFGIAALNGW